ncbi:molybdopterin-dependent oxidoreductase [uncultured Methanobrevibacter sp.]|uniref:molybdopterin-dependent oxidoreductase n=1 Tax=uncultured Methanobrevibacter sp. TaxID=253161 RepID=UPI002612890E|nr:molybdopterin-dependent oxidoreductase [uncultured Methanobrevibacter sp.]
MFEIKHTLCPSCSVGCGINVILDGEEIVGTFPYKRHPVNAGKNCLNGRNSIDCFKNKFENVDLTNSIADASNEIKSANASDVSVICSGNCSVEDIAAIKDFAESNGFNIGFYANDLKNFEDVASYDEIANASKVFVIGDLLYENPLIGRRIVHAKQNDAKIYALSKNENAVTFNIADEISNSSVQEFLDKFKGEIDDSSVVVFNYVDEAGDLDKIESLNCKALPVFSKPNTKGALDIIDSKSADEMVELFDNTKLLLVFNDDVVDEFDYDFTKISKIITFACCENDTTKISNIVVPVKTWLEQDGSFVNAMGEVQNFNCVIGSDNLGIIEVIGELNK